MMKRALTAQEKRTIRMGGIALAAYLVLFGGVVIWKGLAKRRAGYLAEVAEAQELRGKIQIYRDKAELIGDLMARFHMDPTTLARTSIVAQASAAIQKAATDAGIKPGTIRESAARSTAREMAAIQFEGSGPVNAVMSLLYHLPTLGFPLIVDTLQITSDPRMPGGVKLNLTIAILDFEQWSEAQEENPHA